MQSSGSVNLADFWDAPGSAGVLKAGFLGFEKSGKTITSVFLACAAREVLGLTGPISFFDTETGSDYTKGVIQLLTGKPALIKKSRAFGDALRWIEASEKAGASVGVCDSVTHLWRELCDSYMEQKNRERQSKGLGKRTFLAMDDWGVLKGLWADFTTAYLTSPISLIVCGRAGFKYENTVDEENGKKGFETVGVKMKAEGEFGYEPSLLVQMELEQTLEPGSRVPTQTRRAIVHGDRFMAMDGATRVFKGRKDPSKPFTDDDIIDAYQAVKDFFMPHLERLTRGAVPTLDTTTKTHLDIDESGDLAWQRERRERDILVEEVKGDLTLAFPGQGALEKQSRISVLREAFGTSSETALEGKKVAELRAGRTKLQEILEKRTAPKVSTIAAAPAPGGAPPSGPSAPPPAEISSPPTGMGLDPDAPATSDSSVVRMPTPVASRPAPPRAIRALKL